MCRTDTLCRFESCSTWHFGAAHEQVEPVLNLCHFCKEKKKKGGKWFSTLSQYSRLDGCKTYVGVLWCFEFILKIGTTWSCVRVVSNFAAVKVWKKNKAKSQRERTARDRPFQMKTQTVLHKTWHKHPPSAPLQNRRHNKTREPEQHCSFIQSTPWLLDKQETIAQHPLPWHQGLCHRHTLKQCLNMQI